MKILKVIQHPLVKNIAIIGIIYFAFFSNKQNPESLGNRLSVENLKKTFNNVSQKTSFIAENVSMAKSLAKERVQRLKRKHDAVATLEVKDLKEGLGREVECGDVATISYGVFDAKDKKIHLGVENVTIGLNDNIFLEQETRGMKAGGIRIVFIPENFNIEDSKIKEFLSTSKGNLEYRIKLEKFQKLDNLKLACNEE